MFQLPYFSKYWDRQALTNCRPRSGATEYMYSILSGYALFVAHPAVLVTST